MAVPAIADNAQGKALFDEGVIASREGHHQRAQQLFYAALKQGYNIPALHYNLGVTYYRQGNFQQSKAEFQQLLNNKGLSPIACYNLGLIAAKNGEDRVAINYFGIAYNISENADIRRLSKIALERFNTKVEEISSLDPVEVESGTDGFVSLGLVRDSNVNLVNDELNAASEQKGTAQELLASLNTMLLGLKSNGLQFSALADLMRYREINISDVYDTSQYHLALSYINEHDFLQMQYEVGYDSIDVGKQKFQRIGSGAIRSRLFLKDANYIRMVYQFMSIDSDDILYRYLNGVKHKVSLDLTLPKGNHKYRLGFIVEQNNREDDLNNSVNPSTVAFRSYSALKSTLRAVYYYRMSQAWRMKLDMQFRHSDYKDEDRLILSGLGDELNYTHIDNQRRVIAGLTANLDKNWQVTLSQEYVDNQSNRQGFISAATTAETASYTRSITSLSLDWYF